VITMKMTKEKTRIIATRAKMKHSGEKTIQGTRQTEANILLGASLELSSLGIGVRGVARGGKRGRWGEAGRRFAHKTVAAKNIQVAFV
jgi:hypothetical protein